MTKSLKGLLVLVATGMLFTMTGIAGGVVVDRIVAKVNDEIITLSEVQEKGLPLLSKVRSTQTDDGKEVQKAEKEVLEYLIDTKLQLQDAKDLGMTVSEKEVETILEDIKTQNGVTQEALERMLEEEGSNIQDYRDAIRERMLLQRIYQFRVIASAKVKVEDIEAYYRAHISDFSGPEKVRVRQIFFFVDPNHPARREDVVMARATEVLERIKAGEDFVKLAKSYSEGPDADKGGDLGYFQRGEALPVLEDAMFRLDSGQVSGLIRSRDGFHILKVEEHIYSRPLPLEEVKEQISYILKKEKAEENYGVWREKLRRKAFVEITYDLETKSR